MLDPIARPLKNILLRPLAKRLYTLPPAVVTLVALVSGLAAAGLLASGEFAGGLLLWLANRTLDGLDGVVARENGRQTDFGGYLDIMADFVVYAAVPLGLVLGMGAQPEQWMALVVLLSSFYVNTASWMYLAALLEKRFAGAATRGESTSITMPDALVGGTETVVLFSVFILLPGYLVPLFWLMAVLVGVSIGQRLWWAHGALVPVTVQERAAAARATAEAGSMGARSLPLRRRSRAIPVDVL